MPWWNHHRLDPRISPQSCGQLLPTGSSTPQPWECPMHWGNCCPKRSPFDEIQKLLMVRKELFIPRLRFPGNPGTPQKKGPLEATPKSSRFWLFFSLDVCLRTIRDTGNTCFLNETIPSEVAWARNKSLTILVVFKHNSDKNLWESPWKILHPKDLPGFWCYFGGLGINKKCTSIKFQPVTASKTPHIQHEKHLCFFHSPTLQKCWPFPGTPNNHLKKMVVFNWMIPNLY